MKLRARARMRPVLYPAVIASAYVLNLIVGTGVSPYAGLRPLIIVVTVGLAVPWLIGLVTGHRHLAGLMTGILLLVALAAPSASIYLLAIAALTLPAVALALVRRTDAEARARLDRMWGLATRILTAVSVVFLVAVGVTAVQEGRAQTIGYDLVAEFPLKAGSATRVPAIAGLPDIYLVLLDGYPRADKLRSEFGIDVSWFTQGLTDRGFAVASRSRSNQTATRLTLRELFDYDAGIESVGTDGDRDDLWRHKINSGRFLGDIRGLGYEVVAISPGWEHVALRQADRFIDTGQPNEFEWALLRESGLGPTIAAWLPELAASLHRARLLAAFDTVEALAHEGASGPRLVFAHVAAPHSPLVFMRDGSPLLVRGTTLEQAESVELAELGREEFQRRLDGQVSFVSDRTLGMVDRVIAADADAVIVLFSDHGTGVRNDPIDPAKIDADLRTANFLAVRSPGATGIIDDRSTLVNVLPRLMRAYAGVGPPDVPETIYIAGDVPNVSHVYMRPD